jgi:hypothetical protein
MMDSKQTTPLRGKALMVAVVNQILDKPACWNQSAWHCGTSHCFGGWAQVLGGKPADEMTVQKDAREMLELDAGEAEWLFAGYRLLPELHGFVAAKLAGEDYWSRAGYNRDGYNRDGYNRDGYNRAGYDRAGYDRAGYDRAGYNRAGYNRAGYDRDGYNRDGYDRDGYDRDGYNRDGSKLPRLVSVEGTP